jgi:hypothetical protein
LFLRSIQLLDTRSIRLLLLCPLLCPHFIATNQHSAHFHQHLVVSGRALHQGVTVLVLIQLTIYMCIESIHYVLAGDPTQVHTTSFA